MAGINITVTNSTLNDNASVIRNLYEAPAEADYEQIERELQIIKSRLKEGSRELQVVETLEQSSKARNWEAICTAIGKFASQFTGATLANLAGYYLSQRFGLG